MPKPNYAYEKRQRELEKKRKKEDKASRKTPAGDIAPAAGSQQPTGAAPLSPAGATTD